MPKKTADAEAPVARSRSGVWLLGLLVLAVAGGGFGAWYSGILTPTPPGPKPHPPIRDAGSPSPSNPVAPATKTDGGGGDEKPVVEQAPKEKPLTLAEERGATLAMMAKAAEDPERNRSVPFCERLTAQTAADCDDLDMANSFLDRLKRGKAAVAFYRVPPLTSIAWQQLKKGDKAAASKTLDEVVSLVNELPSEGRFSIDAAAWLSAALVAAGRDGEATTLAGRFPARGSAGRLVADMSTAAVTQSWDVSAARAQRPLLDVVSLEFPTVVEIATTRGFPTDALRFVQGISDPALKTECEIVWGESVTAAQLRRPPATPLSIEPVVEKLSAPAKARLQARMGFVQLAHGDRGDAEKSLEAALAALKPAGADKTPTEFAMPSLKALITFTFPDPKPLRMKALAWAEIARLEGGLKKTDEARKHLERGLGELRGSAPGPIAAEKALENLRSQVSPARRKALRGTLKLKNDEDVKSALNSARKNAETLLRAAQSRFALEVEVLKTALAWDDDADIWKMIESRLTAAQSDQKEPFFETGLPWRLAVNLERSGDKATSAKIAQAAGSETPPVAAVLEMLADDAGAAAGATSINKLAKAILTLRGVEKSDRERAALAGSSVLLRAGKLAEAFQLVRTIDDELMKEEGLQWTAALAVRLDLARPTRDTLQAASFVPNEFVAAWRGFLLGLLARDSVAEAPRPPDAAAKPYATRQNKLRDEPPA